MMTYDENTVFQREMQKGKQYIGVKNYDFALFSFTLAYGIATDAKDESRKDAYEYMEFCNSKLDPNYEPKPYEPLDNLVRDDYDL